MCEPFGTSCPIIMPVPMHPLHSGATADQLARLRRAERRMRIFFSGDTHQYTRVWVRYPKTKLPRQQVVDAIKNQLGDELALVHDSQSLRDLLQGDYRRQCVITASSEVRIEFDDWLPTLAQGDFFLCPPGIVMPMCHNIIEAMAVGAIPITNYPEWMDPRLVPGVNCVAFDDEQDLLGALRRALVPLLERATVVAVRAVDAETLRHVHHQAVGRLGLLDVARAAGRQRRRRDQDPGPARRARAGRSGGPGPRARAVAGG